LAQATADEVLELFVATKAKHFFTTADGVFELQIVVNETEKLVELVSFLAGKDIDQFVSNMVRDSTGETCLAYRSGSSRGSHRELTLTQPWQVCDGFVRILALRPIWNEQKWQIEP
jgi:hypothetical protein